MSYSYQIIPKPTRKKGESAYKAIESSVSEANLFIYRRMFRVLADVHFWVPGRKERADQPPMGSVAMNFDIIITGVQFPLHTIISKYLNYLNLAPTQITPNVWSIIMGIMSLFGRL